MLLKKDYTLERLQSWDTLGMRGTHSEGFTLRARAPAQQIIPEPYEKIHPQTMVPHAHILWGSVWAGIAAVATAKAQAFVRNALRASGGQMPPGAAHFTQAASSLRTLRGVLSSALRSYQAAMADEKALGSLEFQSMITLTKVQASELAAGNRARGAAGMRVVRLPQRQRVQHRPASARRAVRAAHDQQRPHPRQSRDDLGDDLAARVDQRLKRGASHERAQLRPFGSRRRRRRDPPRATIARGAVPSRWAWTASTRAPRSIRTDCERLEAYITTLREPAAEIMRFPPVMSRKQLEKSGYLKSFPNLLGCVCALHGTEASIRAAADRHEKGGDWTEALSASDLVLSPAACYPVYPIAAARGTLPRGRLAVRHRGRRVPA